MLDAICSGKIKPQDASVKKCATGQFDINLRYCPEAEVNKQK